MQTIQQRVTQKQLFYLEQKTNDDMTASIDRRLRWQQISSDAVRKTCDTQTHTCVPFSTTRGVLLLQGIQRQGTPPLDRNDRSSPTGCVELECPFYKGLLKGMLQVCVSVCSSLSISTLLCQCAIASYSSPIKTGSLEPIGLCYIYLEALVILALGGLMEGFVLL